MRIMKQKLILFLLSVTMPFCVMAAELGADGLHKQSWMRDTFKDLREDLDEANSEGKRLVLMFEQRGCIYCSKNDWYNLVHNCEIMNNNVLSMPSCWLPLLRKKNKNNRNNKNNNANQKQEEEVVY